MIVRKFSDVKAEDVKMEESKGVKKRVLISKADGAPNFVLRRFTVEPGGFTAYHNHSWEHEIYVLAGTGELRLGETSHELSAGTVVLVLPDEKHNFVNVGREPLDFLCTIPK